GARDRVPARARDLVGRLARLVGLGGLLLLLARERVGDLARRLVDERPRAVDDLDGPRVEPRELRAGTVAAATRLDVLRRAPGDAALEPDDALEVVRQHRAAQIAAHEHDHRVVAEARVQLRRRLVRR